MQPAGFITDARELEAKLRNQHRGKGTQVGTRSFLTGGKKRCSTQGAARLFSGRPRQPAATPIYKSMTEQTIRTSRMVRVVKVRPKHVDHQNRSTWAWKNRVVNWSSRISNLMDRRQEKKSKSRQCSCYQAIGKNRFRLDHLTTPADTPAYVLRSQVVNTNGGEVDHPDHLSAEVTL